MLDLGPSQYTPRLVEGIVLLGTLFPFEQVPAVLAVFTQVQISAETARRLTEAAGAAAVALAAAEVAANTPARPAPSQPVAGTSRPKLVVNGKPTRGHRWKQGSPSRRAS